MACLLDTNDVVCFYNDNHFRVKSVISCGRAFVEAEVSFQASQPMPFPRRLPHIVRRMLIVT